MPVQSASDLAIPTFDDVADAAARLAGVAHRTPVLTSSTADARTGATIFFKCENFQRMGAFKFRGAYNSISHFDAEQRRAGVLTYSSGNHAQAIALAARLAGIHATIVMPHDAPAAKVAATKGYGGEVITYDRYTESREEIGARLAQERGMTLVPPYDHPHVIAGQGTAAKELIDEVGELDMLVVPLGGGGLIAGSALSAAALAAGCAVIGVEPEAGNDAQQSLARGEVVHIPVPRTIADGAASTHVGAYNFPIIQKLVKRIVTVSDAQLIEAMRFFAERMKMVVEPTGCLGAAAVLDGVLPVAGKRIGVILSGGNVDLARYGEFLRG
ncbi:threo-3-hydroxy-L-aspartate ammonia-lyase [Burkholderia oklahomensis]|uniref:threo-3-hydroxy-L-aspartate ammonia-lyase n=1 Tax=Burkholderia oklahomensis TaxID=342113 RepID=UPI0004739634|nr:threo-3-hydroxy-L-aspartate ammonia-lyase [Burkholderia oklahomensis]AJX33393.1 pyridoxal-phosphate dependent enzyme family protein [Burkholderia oklahomensis C6786]AOI45153.1 serine dehydratase [Burkholderia oklahomensis C6786]KUY47758.1 serine dehydratase [Burkholderia oklahomensis C6786]MBI0358787.1 threo-3-hydroxy-L-aspartate ammonia-lyase [Burkholderia oklahomensis]SUW57235.1 L-threonine dehydratase catabolic TdcB [Burkholderia oklahomensis]